MAQLELANAIYQELGVRPIIHAGGTKTWYGGSRVSGEVLEAMAQAAQSFVNIEELNRAIGRYIASITGAEAGMVTSGAASGVVLSIAACMTGSDLAKVRQLPDSRGMRDELVIQKIHRGHYSHMYTFAGAKFVEVGNMIDCPPRELEAAIHERTAAVAYLCGPGIPNTGLTLSEVVAISHSRDVPVIVDAAAMLPPRSNLQRYIREGADLVTFSGGKWIHGPQATGLLFGRRDLIDAAVANSNPHHSIGRPHKVSRENMVGLYQALKLYMAQEEDATIAHYRHRLAPVLRFVKDIEGIDVKILQDEVKYHVPTAVITLTTCWQGAPAKELAQRLLTGEPRIYVLHDQNSKTIAVNPISLSDDEATIVGQRLREVLCENLSSRPAATDRPARQSTGS